MPYPESMRPSLKRLEATRAERLREVIPRMDPEQKTALLHEFHPDFRAEGMRAVRVGPNTGDRVPNEFADQLEARSRIDPETFDLQQVDHDVDVLVLGGGGGGSTAALVAQENGASVLLATKLRHGDSNTTMAEGGIAAASHRHDNPYLHYLDTLGGGRYMNKPDLVQALVLDAPLILDWLLKLGVMFDREADGTLICSLAGGQSRKRIHSAKDYSGLEMMRVLRDECRNRQIQVLEFAPAVELLKDEAGQCAGAILYNFDTDSYQVVRAKAVILATGGIGRLHIQGFPTTNHYGATADGLVLAYRAGARLLYMDAIQYHPTGAAWPEQMLGWLCTEALRGTGAHLVNVEGQRFINELETRDATSSAIIREVNHRKKGITTPAGNEGVWLDTPIIDMIGHKGKIHRLFAGLERRFNNYGIDMTKEPLFVYPTQHYQNGGVDMVDPAGRSGVPNLFLAGEVAGGVQGRNRLGGNSLVDIFVFGRRAGQAAARQAKEARLGPLTLQHVREHHRALEEAGISNGKVSPLLLPDYVVQHR
ncbi:MAG TPA: FAD-binding protein [Candidatus Methylomirabilis sp.]|nr:FAD-binding protein [Candidatus Methylomirabilis sp.]